MTPPTLHRAGPRPDDRIACRIGSLVAERAGGRAGETGDENKKRVESQVPALNPFKGLPVTGPDVTETTSGRA